MEFVEWARAAAVPITIPAVDENFDDLGFLSDVIGDQRVVSVGETAHYIHEWNRLCQIKQAEPGRSAAARALTRRVDAARPGRRNGSV